MGQTRVIPVAPQTWTPPRPEAGCSFEIELITPLFGGGVETRVNDVTFPIRPTSIRGQLELWWRATVGAQYESPAELRAAQTELWGNTERASRVQVRVERVDASDPVPCARYEQDQRSPGRLRSMPLWHEPFHNTALPYALFPFQGQLARGGRQIEVEPARCIHRARFQLTLLCDPGIEFDRQVEPAVWAWVNFGGLGSRTRRGCGAICCAALAPRDASDLRAAWTRRMPQTFPARAWPTLAAALLVGPPQSDAIRAWDLAIKLLREFRQGVGLGRNPGQQPNRPGRSRWPEPETIRRVTRKRSPQHQRLSQIPDDAFPRAEFGLPVVFHFKDQGESPETVLYPGPNERGEQRDRMASPLMLRPVALQERQFLPVILQLQGPMLDRVDLREGSRSLDLPPPTYIRHAKLAQYPNSPLQGRSARGSAVEAFLAYAQSQRFTRVV